VIVIRSIRAAKDWYFILHEPLKQNLEHFAKLRILAMGADGNQARAGRWQKLRAQTRQFAACRIWMIVLPSLTIGARIASIPRETARSLCRYVDTSLGRDFTEIINQRRKSLIVIAKRS